MPNASPGLASRPPSDPGSSYDKAAAQALNRLCKTELIRRHGPRRTPEHVELEVLE